MGKTSIIHSLTSEDPLDSLPAIHSPVKIPNDQCLENCSLTIIDSFTENLPDSSPILEEELDKATVILLVYDITQPNSVKRLETLWLPYLSKHTNNPIIIIGNKLDLKSSSPDHSFDNVISLLHNYAEMFEVVIECSAKSLENLYDVFIHMQNAVLYPLSPLYNIKNERITKEFEKALALVFKRCDKDRDGFLSEEEFCDMQSEVFQSQVKIQEVKDIYNVIKERKPVGVENKGLNFQGLCFLQELTMQKLQNSVCWKLVKHFGYGDGLELIFHSEEITECPWIELSMSSLSFLIATFDQYAISGMLSKAALSKIFFSCKSTPFSKHIDKLWMEFEDTVFTENNCINTNAWLGFWQVLGQQNRANCAKNLLLIGYDLPIRTIFTTFDIKTQKSVMTAYVIGANYTGKSYLLNGLIGNYKSIYTPTTSVKITCNIIEESPIPWENKYLVLVEFPVICIENVFCVIDNSDCVVVMKNESKDSDDFFKEIPMKKLGKAKVVDNTKMRILKEDFCEIFKGIFNYCKEEYREEKIELVIEKRRSSGMNWVMICGILVCVLAWICLRK